MKKDCQLCPKVKKGLGNSMTITERNERIAEKVLKWKKHDCGYSWCKVDNLPNFISDDSTMAMLVKGLAEHKIDVEFQKREGLPYLAILTSWDKTWRRSTLSDDSFHAALIAAIENMIESEGE